MAFTPSEFQGVRQLLWQQVSLGSNLATQQ